MYKYFLKGLIILNKKLLESNMFFGIKLTEEQKIFRDAIFDDNCNIVFCNAAAGTGKTLIAVASAKLLVSSGKYNGLTYVFSAVQESTLGYSTGSIEEKESKYLSPLHDALITINEIPEKSIISNCANTQKKNSYAWVKAKSHTFMRGINIDREIIVLEETQNMTIHEIKKILTRCHDSSKIICIGHVGQIDLRNKSHSGFERYINHFADKEKCSICTLTQNFRGWVATHADQLVE
jgi:predicted ribonuclease YlaK